MTGNPNPGLPGAIIVLPPGGSIGSTRASVVEIKAAINSLVVPLEAGSARWDGAAFHDVRDQDHLTIHDNLMVHLQGRKAKPHTLLPCPLLQDGRLDGLAVHLATVGGVPGASSVRQQARYEGGIAIISANPDERYAPTDHLLMDIWACSPGFGWPEQLPATWEGARPIQPFHHSVLGPVPAPWAFRIGPVPACTFAFRFWFAAVAGERRPFVSSTGRVIRLMAA